jgi:hypothetical protein
MTIELLYPLLTEAIRRAELLEDLRNPRARAAYSRFPFLEEKVAEMVGPSDPEALSLEGRGARCHCC